MKVNSKLLDSFLSAEKEYRKQENKIEKYFKKQVEPTINKATTLEELQEVKEFLRNMPQIAGKVLIFRTILLKEEEIKKNCTIVLSQLKE